MTANFRQGLVTILCLLAACGGEQEGDSGTTDPGVGGATVGIGGAMTAGTAGNWITPGGSAGTAGTAGSVGGSSGGSTTTMPAECLINWATAGSEGTMAGSGSASGAAGSPSTTGAAGASSDAAMMPIPYTTFNIINGTASTLYTANSSSCQIDLKIYSCADGFLQPIDYLPGCMGSCSLGAGVCVNCGMCASSGTTLLPNAVTSIYWDGSLYERNYANGGCGCYNQVSAPYGMYRAELTVYADSNLQEQFYSVSQDFYYQGPGTNVTLSF